MVDIRRPVCGILVAGSTAPGINGVISAVVIQCVEWDLVPIGFLRGFKYLKQGKADHCVELKVADVSRMHNRGGSLLATSKEQLETEEDISNTIDVLRHLKVRYLITIGGTSSAFSAHKLAAGLRERRNQHFIKLAQRHRAARKSMSNMDINGNLTGVSLNMVNNENAKIDNSLSDSGDEYALANQDASTLNNDVINGMINGDIESDFPNILITHVPKTIFNDLPLPDNCYTFGFSTAREIGVKIVSNLSIDAKTMHRWYIVTCIGARTGHLALAIGKAAAATMTLVPEQFRHRDTRKHKPTQYDYESALDHKMKKQNGKPNEKPNHKYGAQYYRDLLDDNKEMKNDSQNNNNLENETPNTQTSEATEEYTTDDKFRIAETPSPGVSMNNSKEFKKSSLNDLSQLYCQANGNENNLNSKTSNNSNNNNNIKKGDTEEVNFENLNNHPDIGKLKLSELVDIIDACMIKRLSQGKDYGVAVISEGLADMLEMNDLNRYFDGSIDKAHELLGPQLARKLARRWSKRKHEVFIRAKFIGYELRSDDPNAHDIILSRNLGYAAVFSCKIKNINATIVAIKGGELVSIPLSEMMDPDTNSPTVKGVCIESLTYTVAQSYMIKLTKADLKDSNKLKKMAHITGLDVDSFRKTYSYIAA